MVQETAAIAPLIIANMVVEPSCFLPSLLLPFVAGSVGVRGALEADIDDGMLSVENCSLVLFSLRVKNCSLAP